jgi:hypothetical protein
MSHVAWTSWLGSLVRTTDPCISCWSHDLNRYYVHIPNTPQNIDLFLVLLQQFGCWFVLSLQTNLSFDLSTFHLNCSFVYTFSIIMYAFSLNLDKSKEDIWVNSSMCVNNRPNYNRSINVYKVVRRWSDNFSNKRTQEGLWRQSNEQISTISKTCVTTDL